VLNLGFPSVLFSRMTECFHCRVITNKLDARTLSKWKYANKNKQYPLCEPCSGQYRDLPDLIRTVCYDEDPEFVSKLDEVNICDDDWFISRICDIRNRKFVAEHVDFGLIYHHILHRFSRHIVICRAQHRLTFWMLSMNVFKDTFWEEFTDISILKKSYKVTEVPPSEQMKLVNIFSLFCYYLG